MRTPYSLGSHHVAKLVIRGTLVFALALELLLLSYGFLTDDLQAIRIVVGGFSIAYILVAHWAFVTEKFTAASIIILSFYFLIASACLSYWGINTATGLLILGFIIFLSGILLGMRTIVPVGIVCIAAIISIHTVHLLGLVVPDRSALAMESHIGDIVTYSALLGVFALISWITSFHINTSFSQLQKTKVKLRQQKEALAIKLEEESQKLREAQLAEMQQLYAFAQIGQSTTAVLHELANQLSVLTFDINGLAENSQPKKTVVDAQNSIHQINRTIHEVRARIRTKSDGKIFDLVPLVRDITQNIKTPNITYGFVSQEQHAFVQGDPSNLSNVMLILLGNARDACLNTKDARVESRISCRTEGKLLISVTDNGCGLSDKARQVLFRPQPSAKKHSMGIGLYIAKNIIESQFAGTLEYDHQNQTQTSFLIKLPLNNLSHTNE